jgi:hypothetical protein
MKNGLHDQAISRIEGKTGTEPVSDESLKFTLGELLAVEVPGNGKVMKLRGNLVNSHVNDLLMEFAFRLEEGFKGKPSRTV